MKNYLSNLEYRKIIVDSDISLFPHSPKLSNLIDSDYFGKENKPYSGKIILGLKMP